MEKQERWVLAICTTVLMSIAFGISLHNVGVGICIGICMGAAFGLCESEGEDDDKQ